MCGAASARRGGALRAPRREQSTRCQCCPDHHHHHDDNDGDDDGDDDNNNVYDDHDADVQNPPNVIWYLSYLFSTIKWKRHSREICSMLPLEKSKEKSVNIHSKTTWMSIEARN